MPSLTLNTTNWHFRKKFFSENVNDGKDGEKQEMFLERFRYGC
jgi:hypothetical protein